MPKITFHRADGGSDTLDVPAGTTIMRAALGNGIDGIVGECGGQAMCATCHVQVCDTYLDAIPEIGDDEDEMLDATAEPRDPRRSRLACQLTAGGDFDAIEVDVPESQV